MAKYKISLRKSAIKELGGVPKKDLQKVTRKIQTLATNPRPQGSQKLSQKEQYRIRQDLTNHWRRTPTASFCYAKAKQNDRCLSLSR
jgi:hypothetical protein